ncbi:hypothetical protein [Massilia orientalis]|uniref:Uncharacterized protein n=1 Tax=Massilia orientalis TaxID=3050128 RepID=A0ACC7MKU9_9BURK|nr:hypothetical protein [Massilia sp. YIM B02787]
MSKHINNINIACGGPTVLLTPLALARLGNCVIVMEAEDKPNESSKALTVVADHDKMREVKSLHGQLRAVF